jgi:putative membrane protein
MNLELLLRYVHFISIFTIVATLAGEYLLVKKTMTRAELDRLSRIDALYGIAALVLLGAGLTLWLGSYGKPAIVYSKNWIFHLKLGLFVVIGLLSVYPTVFFLRHRKGDPAEWVTLPAAIFWMLRLEIGLLVVIPMLAGLMSRGIGYFG